MGVWLEIQNHFVDPVGKNPTPFNTNQEQYITKNQPLSTNASKIAQKNNFIKELLNDDIKDVEDKEDKENDDLLKLNDKYKSEEFKQFLIPKKEKFKNFQEPEINQYNQEEIMNSADDLGIDG